MSEHSYVSIKTHDEVVLWSNGGPPLNHLDIELTERCNNRCIHCSINLPHDDSGARHLELTTPKIKKFITEAAGLGALSVRFTGGEPLLREDFEDIYTFSRKQGLKVILFTNARLITPRLASLFSKFPPLEKIEVSVYGMTEKSYESVSRERGSFSEFIRGVDLLLSHKVPFIVKSALLPPNSHEIEDFEIWARSIPWMIKSPSFAVFFNLRDRRDSISRNEAIKKLRISPEEGLKVLKKRSPCYLQEMSQFCNKFMGPPGDSLFVCGAGYRPCIDSYGTVQPCLSLRHPSTGYHLESGSLHDALSFFQKIRELKATNSEYLSRCAQCFLKSLCEQCPAKSWSEHGTLDTPVEYFCNITHAQARDLGLINGNENGWEVEKWKERVARLQ